MEILNEKQTEHDSEHHSKQKVSDNKKLLLLIGMALLLLIGIWIWKSIVIKNIKSKAASDYQSSKQNAIKGIVTSQKEH